jgi:hypothetical protein
VVNGQFTLLADSFANAGRGATVITVELTGDHAFQDLRERVIGHSDLPSECSIGSVRRDAADGHLSADATAPVTPWANVVHGSDGYFAGLVETIRLSHYPRLTMMTSLLDAGYTDLEVEGLLLSNPVVACPERQSHLTQLTRLQSLADCLATIQRMFPPAAARIQRRRGIQDGEVVRPFLAKLYAELSSGEEPNLEVPIPERTTHRPVQANLISFDSLDRDPLPPCGPVGFLIPLAGTSGRFGGYHLPEGSPRRIKAMLPLFTLDGRQVSALDVRVIEAERWAQQGGQTGRYFMSCSHSTEPAVRSWIESHPDIDAALSRVPELIRFAAAGPAHSPTRFQDNVLRDPDGLPLTKPFGSFGLLWAALTTGTLDRWERDGVEYVAAANADDVGFRPEPPILRLLAENPNLDAVVVAVSPDPARPIAVGGLLRRRLGPSGWSTYVEEKAPVSLGQDYFSTNQIYFRLPSLVAALHSVRVQDLPVYLERKPAPPGTDLVPAMHAYRPYCDILRIMSDVAAVHIAPRPSGHQSGSYCPLKRLSDLTVAQRTIDLIAGRRASQ